MKTDDSSETILEAGLRKASPRAPWRVSEDETDLTGRQIWRDVA